MGFAVMELCKLHLFKYAGSSMVRATFKPKYYGGGVGGSSPPPPPHYVQSPKAKNLLLHFRILERILRGSCEKNITPRGKNFHAGSHVRVTVSPQPYDLIQRTIYDYVPLRRSNNILSYNQNYKHSYKML